VEQIGRWACSRCGRTCVAAGRRASLFRGIAAYTGPCPWGCGACVGHAFRFVRPRAVAVYTSDDWNDLQLRTEQLGGDARLDEMRRR